MSFETDKQFCQGEAKTDDDNAVRLLFFFLRSLSVFLWAYVCVHMCHVCAAAWGVQKRMSGPLELGLQGALSSLIWKRKLGTPEEPEASFTPEPLLQSWDQCCSIDYSMVTLILKLHRVFLTWHIQVQSCNSNLSSIYNLY